MMSGPEGTVPKDLQRLERCLLLRIRLAGDVRNRCAFDTVGGGCAYRVGPTRSGPVR